jgi:hypothetical protein
VANAQPANDSDYESVSFYSHVAQSDNINPELLASEIVHYIESLAKEPTNTSLVREDAAKVRTFYVDAQNGNDSNTGLSAKKAWKSLEKVNSVNFVNGDRLLFKKGLVYPGSLMLKATGTETAPVVVDAYGTGSMPVIDGKGQLAAMVLDGCSYLEVNNLEFISDGGEPVVPQAATRRDGISITYSNGNYHHIVLRGLYVHDVFATNAMENQAGFGINVQAGTGGALRGFVIENCRIERTAATGIMIRGGRGEGLTLRDLKIINNKLTDIGGPGMNPMMVANLLVNGNIVTRSGSVADARMRGRGSCIWPWGSDSVLIEKNVFTGARGINDCCGAHIDFNCKNVIIQYNLSMDNEGGFVEILGNNHNCSYRYNISINDGARVKGEERLHPNGSTLKMALDGKTIFLSSFVGNNAVRNGPYNSYIYNNTIFVKEDMHSVYNFTRVTDGALVANNILYVLGPTKMASDEEGRVIFPDSVAIKNVMVKNNLYLKPNTLPANLPLQDGKPITDSSPIIGDPMFKNAGGNAAEDYIPANAALIKDRSIKIEKLPGDKVGLYLGLEVTKDFFGNPIVGTPDLGAVEMK